MMTTTASRRMTAQIRHMPEHNPYPWAYQVYVNGKDYDYGSMESWDSALRVVNDLLRAGAEGIIGDTEGLDTT